MSEIKVVWKIIGRKPQQEIQQFEQEVNSYLSNGWKLINGSLGGTQGLMAFLLKE